MSNVGSFNIRRCVRKFALYFSLILIANTFDPFSAAGNSRNFSADLFNYLFANDYPPGNPDDDEVREVTVVLWTDDALKKMGWQWPLSKLQHAEALASIREFGPKSVMADYALTDEPAKSSLYAARLQSIIQKYCKEGDQTDEPAANEAVKQWIEHCRDIAPLYDEIIAFRCADIPLLLVAGPQNGPEIISALKGEVELVGVPGSLSGDHVFRTYRTHWPDIEGQGGNAAADPVARGRISAAFRLYPEHADYTRRSPAMPLGKDADAESGKCEHNKFDRPGREAVGFTSDRGAMHIFWGTANPNNRWLKSCRGAKQSRLDRFLYFSRHWRIMREKCPYPTFIPAHLLFEGTPTQRVRSRLHRRHVLYGNGVTNINTSANTPIHGPLPGIFIHAMALDNLISYQGNYKIAVSSWMYDVSALIILSVVLLMSVIYMDFISPRTDAFIVRVREKSRFFSWLVFIHGNISSIKSDRLKEFITNNNLTKFIKFLELLFVFQVHLIIWTPYFLVLLMTTIVLTKFSFSTFDIAPGDWVGIVLVTGVMSPAMNQSLVAGVIELFAGTAVEPKRSA